MVIKVSGSFYFSQGYSLNSKCLPELNKRTRHFFPFFFPVAPVMLKKKMPLRKPIWAYQPYQQKMNLNSGCRWWYWDNAWWVRNIVGGKMCIIIFCLCVSMFVSIHAIHTRSLRNPTKVISFVQWKENDNQTMSTILKVLADPIRILILHYRTKNTL